jgi:hypothetical protein
MKRLGACPHAPGVMSDEDFGSLCYLYLDPMLLVSGPTPFLLIFLKEWEFQHRQGRMRWQRDRFFDAMVGKGLQ